MLSFVNKMEEVLITPLSKLAQNIILQSIRDAFVIFALPVILTGSLFLIVANPPDAIELGIIQAWADAVEPIQAQILFPFELTFGLMALTVAFGVGHSLASRRNMDAVMAGMLSMLAFFMTAFPVKDIAEVEFGEAMQFLGGEGLFVAIILGIFTTEGMRFLTEKGLTFEMPDGVPPYVIRTFRALLPFMILLPLVWIVQWIVWANFEMTIPQAVLNAFEPFVAVADTYFAALGMIILMMLLWSLGIHGMNVVSSVAYPFWMTQLAENADAVAEGAYAEATGIVTEPFFHMFAHIGGSGTTLALAIFMVMSASKQIKQVGKMSIIPAIFNINEPIIFGLPIVLNPIMMIPFILGPAVVVTINYILFSTGILEPVIIQPPFTVPVFFGGFIATGGQALGGIVQIANAVIAGLIYWPFFKKYEKQLLEQEQSEQESHEESGEATSTV